MEKIEKTRPDESKLTIHYCVSNDTLNQRLLLDNHKGPGVKHACRRNVRAWLRQIKEQGQHKHLSARNFRHNVLPERKGEWWDIHETDMEDFWTVQSCLTSAGLLRPTSGS